MKAATFATIVVALFETSLATASAQDRRLESDMAGAGKRDFEQICAECHGLSGKGDGPRSGALKKSVPDISLIARKNGGLFPFVRVYRAVEGREAPAAHGAREMPVWSTALMEGGPLLTPLSYDDVVHERILHVVDFVYRLQQ